MTCGFFTTAGLDGVGAPFAGRWWRLFRRPLLRIFSRVRRSAARTSFAVASAHLRCASGRTLV
jgi:hypothetical protein